MADDMHGAQGATDEGASGATGNDDSSERGAPPPESGGRSLNAQAQELPWVKKLMRKSAEFDRMKADQATAQAEAERRKAESQGEYEKALALEQAKYNDLKTQYDTEVKRLQLDAAFAHAGLTDARLVDLFVGGYDLETDAAEYVAAVKADPKNEAFFGKPRRALAAPIPAVVTPPEEFDPERDLQNWLKSKDPKKRDRAVQYNREKYARQLQRG